MQYDLHEVSPFGHPRFKAWWQLPAAYRSRLRPSSVSYVKASFVCACVTFYDLVHLTSYWLITKSSSVICFTSYMHCSYVAHVSSIFKLQADSPHLNIRLDCLGRSLSKPRKLAVVCLPSTNQLAVLKRSKLILAIITEVVNHTLKSYLLRISL